MRQSEFKKQYDPELGRFTRQHIYGEEKMDILKNNVSKVSSQTATKANTNTTAGEKAGEKAGDKIIEFLSRKKKTQKPKKQKKLYNLIIKNMKSFRVPKYIERYEDVVFDLENQINANVANTQHQKRDGLRFVVDNSGETTPFDWYNARFSVDFKVNKLADGTLLTANDNIGTVNGSNSLIKKIQVRAEGREVYDCHYANHCVNIKNLLEYNPSYAESVGTNEYYFPDTSTSPDSSKYLRKNVQHTDDGAGGWEQNTLLDRDNPNYNKGFAARKLRLGTANTDKVNCEIPLNRYSFFEVLQNKLLPNIRIELQIEIESDKNLIWRAGAADAAGTTYRLIITRLQLFIPRIVFNAEGFKLYQDNFLKSFNWSYLTETTYNQSMNQQRSGSFRLTNGISKPRHVFGFFC